MSSLYCDGGVCGRNPSSIGGMWAYILIDNDKIIRKGSGIVTPEDIGLSKITNNLTELLAAIRGLSRMEKEWSGTIYSDSMITIHRITSSYSFKGIPKCLSHKTIQLRRGRKWVAKHVMGHASKENLRNGLGSKWNNWCDEECQRLAKTMEQT